MGNTTHFWQAAFTLLFRQDYSEVNRAHQWTLCASAFGYSPAAPPVSVSLRALLHADPLTLLWQQPIYLTKDLVLDLSQILSRLGTFYWSLETPRALLLPKSFREHMAFEQEAKKKKKKDSLNKGHFSLEIWRKSWTLWGKKVKWQAL